MEPIERYLSNVDKRGPDDCWPWKGPRWQNYGEFVKGYTDGKRISTSAHRYGFQELVRPLELGEVVDHICHNRDTGCPGGDTCEHRACQNPAHWEAVSDNRENVRRGKSFSAENARKTHCKWGHKLTPENSYGYKGRRQCKTCARLASRGQHPRQLGLQPPSPPLAA
jgi:hypothetical protein